MIVKVRLNGITPELLVKIHALENSEANRLPFEFSDLYYYPGGRFYLADEGETNIKHLKYFWVSSSKLRSGFYAIEIVFRMRVETMTKERNWDERRRNKDVVVSRKYLVEVLNLITTELFPENDSIEEPRVVKPTKMLFEISEPLEGEHKEAVEPAEE